ncbi:MAG: ketoacyl-ACP synthase III [Gammaproteobacteria bacterium]|nr:ketoacyl-ACP synthase III [Gammaproteobacteria bacterium]
MKNTRIIGTGSYLPKRIVTNEELSKRVETTHEWIVERSGICQRHIADAEETSSFMATEAAKKAIEAANIEASAIDLILIATTTPDMVLPTVATLVQNNLGIYGIPAFDFAAACAGFIYGLSIAEQFIKAGTYKTILLVGVETMSNVIDWQDRSTCVLFGDGASAVILQASDKPGIISTHLHADGRYKDALYVPTGLPGRANAATPPYVHMEGKEVFKFAVNVLGNVVDEILAANNMTHTDIDWLIPHQANLRIISATAKKLGMPMEKVILTVQDHGNTSAASVPLALDRGVRDGRIKPGQTLLLEAIGGSFVWGASLIIL